MFYDNGTFDTRVLQSYTYADTLCFFVFANNERNSFVTCSNRKRFIH